VERIPGRRWIKKAEETGNQVGVPMAQNLRLVELLKRLAKEIQEDHLAAFAGNLTYKGLFALFPFFVFLLSLLGLFGAPDLSRISSTGRVACCRKGRWSFSKTSS
jgi:membrane protein